MTYRPKLLLRRRMISTIPLTANLRGTPRCLLCRLTAVARTAGDSYAPRSRHIPGSSFCNRTHSGCIQLFEAKASDIKRGVRVLTR